LVVLSLDIFQKPTYSLKKTYTQYALNSAKTNEKHQKKNQKAVEQASKTRNSSSYSGASTVIIDAQLRGVTKAY
jgi:hypothetical protein